MSEFFFSYGLFIAKVVTGLLALVFVMAIVSSGRKRTEGPTLKVTDLNQKYQELKSTVLQAVLDKKQYKQTLKDVAKKDKKDKKSAKVQKAKPKMFVLEFEGDIRASQVETLRDEVTAMLSIAEPQDEVLLKLDNSGGVVHEHGLAASQLQRIKDAKLRFTVSVEKAAGQGGN